jgi:hypothetical protein
VHILDLEIEEGNGRDKIMVSKESNLLFLQGTEKLKGVPYGAFTESMKKQEKVAMWQEICEAGKLCRAFRGKVRAYVRDVLWPNLRNITVVRAKQFNLWY